MGPTTGSAQRLRRSQDGRSARKLTAGICPCKCRGALERLLVDSYRQQLAPNREGGHMPIVDRLVVIGWGSLVLVAVVVLTLRGAPMPIVLGLIACLPQLQTSRDSDHQQEREGTSGEHPQ